MPYRCLLNPFTCITFLATAIRYPADEMLLETALNSRAEALVTLNIADFTPASHFRLPVLPPRRVFAPFARGENLMTNYALRVPESLFAYARKVAEEEHV